MNRPQAVPTSPNPDEVQIRREQIELLYSHGSSVLLGNTLGVVATTALLWNTMDRTILLIWLIVVAIWSLARIAMFRAHNGAMHDRFSVESWGWLFVAGTGVSGFCWGILAWLIPDADTMTLAAIGMILAGLLGGAVPALGTFFFAYLCYASTALLPFALRCFLESNELAYGMGFIAVSYYLCTLMFGRISNRFTRDSIRLRFENLALLRQLQVHTEAAEAARLGAETANASKTRFLAAASHDMRQPLQSITLLADALQAEPLTPTAQDLLASMREASASMGELMDELMDYSRIDTGSLKAEFRSFDIAQILIRIEAEFAPLARQRGLQLTVRKKPARVLSDARMVERILRNLVANAVKYTPRGGVLVGARLRGKNLRLEVWDSGVGIPGDQQTEIFREFYQLDNPERDQRKGLGLGLAIVDGLARLIGQRLVLRSIEGRGSVFMLELPLDTSEAAKEITRIQPIPLPQNLSRVLIIDNEPVIQQAMAALLTAWGCRPIAAESLEHALAQLDTAPDAILADYRLLEGRTGIEAIEGVRQRFGRPIPAAIITGDTDPHRIAEARASGFPLLQKPTPSAHLREVLSKLLSTPAPLTTA
ncbi:MAG: hybrid sensor histidine kinase/response regulator [Rhodocyclaceae bacterium]